MSLRSFIATLIAGSAMLAATAVPVESGTRATRPALYPRSEPSPSSCTKNDAGASFVGVAEQNVAGGINSAVLGGEFNTACDDEDAIAGGAFNHVGFNGGARSSFIGGGSENGITGNTGFIGSGQFNYVAATSAGVGSGALNAATSGGAFVAAGGVAFYDKDDGLNTGYGNVASGLDSFVGAGDLNQVAGSGSFIGAGGYAYAMSGATTAGNTIAGNDSFIGAGDQNRSFGNYSFIGGGYENVAGSSGDAGEYGVIAGGEANTVMGVLGTVSGGDHNNATGRDSVVSGGSLSSATGANATIAGGYLNAADGIGSFAAGTLAKARNNGAFVWSDNSSTNEVQSTAPYQFWARAAGGFFMLSNAAGTAGVKLAPGAGAWSNLSDRSLKTGVVALDDSEVLAKVAALPVSEWSYTSERGVRHVGPMAQDFYAAFRVGEDDRHITSIDEDGVALAAIKALDEQNSALRARLAQSDARLAALERKVELLARRAP